MATKRIAIPRRKWSAISLRRARRIRSTMDQLAQIERDAERFREQAGATVKVIELV
jgi:hypothetical protein